MNNKIILYSLSTCIFCRDTKRLLDECSASYEFIDVDLLNGDKRVEIMKTVRKLNPRGSFPTLKINELVIIGFKEEQTREALKNI